MNHHSPRTILTSIFLTPSSSLFCITSSTDGNQGWIPFYPNQILYFRCLNQEVAPNSPPLPPPFTPTRTRRASTRVRSSRRGSPPPLPPRVGSATPSPPASGFYGVSPSHTKSPSASPTRSNDDGAITPRVTSPSVRSTSGCTPYTRPSSFTCHLSGTRRVASSNQGQQSPQQTGQVQPNEATSSPAAFPLAASPPATPPPAASPPAASPPATTPTDTATGSHNSATPSFAGGSGHGGSPGFSGPVAGQSQEGSQRDEELRGMISDLEEWRDESRARDLQRNRTVSQVLTEIAYLNQCNQDLQRDNQELQRQLYAIHQDYQVLRRDNQAFYQDICSFRQANQNLAQENYDLQQENQTIRQNFRDLRNLNQLREQEIYDLQNQNVHLHHREGSIVCITCNQRLQGGSGAASAASSSSSSPSKSTNPHGPSSLRRLAHAPPQNPQALPPLGEANQPQIGGPSAPYQQGHAAMHQYDRAGSPSGASYVESPILGTSPTLPRQSVDDFCEDDPTGAAAAALVMVSQGQGRVLSEHGSPAAQSSFSSQSLSPAAASAAEFVERDNMEPYNSGTRNY